jgi:DNA-binding NarL/FixJ family response regulator
MAVRVLLADDDARFREFVKRLLGQDMQVVGEPASGDAAVQQARETRPHVVLLDIHIPGLDAITATRRIKAADPEAKVILMTTHDEQAYLSSTGKTGADFMLGKREVRGQILARIRGVLSGFGAPWDGRDRRRRAAPSNGRWLGRERRQSLGLRRG